MSFVVDFVSEDSFFVNLLLGLNKILDANGKITNVHVERYAPTDKSTIANWEHKYGVRLPDDMRNFYQSSDGFLMTWSYNYHPVEEVRIGRLFIRRLCDIFSLAIDDASADTPGPNIGASSKIFEMDSAHDLKTCMVYEDASSSASFWVRDTERRWHALARTFTQFFRMLIAHLGMPHWTHVVINRPLDTPVHELYMLIAPHLLHNRRTKTVATVTYPLSVIDPAIFQVNCRALTKGKVKKKGSRTEI